MAHNDTNTLAYLKTKTWNLLSNNTKSIRIIYGFPSLTTNHGSHVKLPKIGIPSSI